MNGIQEALDAMTAQAWTDGLATGASIIILICMVWVFIDQGKRLLNLAAGHGEADRPVAESVEEYDEGPHGEFQPFKLEQRYEYPDDNSAPLIECEVLEDVDGFDSPEEAEEAHYAAYHEMLDEGDEEAAQAYAQEHGLDVDWDKASRELIQGVISRGDHDLAREMIDSHGWSLDEFDWH